MVIALFGPALAAPLVAVSLSLSLPPSVLPDGVSNGAAAGGHVAPSSVAAAPSWIAGTPSWIPGTRSWIAAAPSWVAPVDGEVRVLRAFDPPAKPWLPGHRGVDLAASPGDTIRAAGAGTVTFASDIAGRGVVVVLQPDGRRTTYEPITATVHAGAEVATGGAIGVLATGGTHCGGIPSCLHWGLRRGLDYLDPLRLLRPGHPLLLPP